MTKILTYEQAKDAAKDIANGYFLFSNGDYKYRTPEGGLYLIIDNKDVLENLNAIDCWNHTNGDFEYKTQDRKWHLV